VTATIQEQIDIHLRALARLFQQVDGRRPTERRLSDREMQVALLAAATPLTYEAIGKRLFIGTSTVKTNVKRAMAKLGVRRRFELPLALRGLGDGQ
jgi:DNA-binding CsgD family transcriptional regulator